MPSGYLVPNENNVRGKLEFLYGEGLEVTTAAGAPDPSKALYGVYLSADDQPVAAALCDVAFGCYAGASLSMIPAGGAQDAAESGEITSGMMENLNEVMNICANLLMDDSTPHLRFEKVYASKAELPDEIQALLDSTDGPAFNVNIPGYGSGTLQLVS